MPNQFGREGCPATIWAISKRKFFGGDSFPRSEPTPSVKIKDVRITAKLMIVFNFGTLSWSRFDLLQYLDQQSSGFWDRGRFLIPSVSLFLRWGRRTLEEQSLIRFSKSAIWNKTYQHLVSHSEPCFHCFTFPYYKWRGINHFLHLNVNVGGREAFEEKEYSNFQKMVFCPELEISKKGNHFRCHLWRVAHNSFRKRLVMMLLKMSW